MAALSIHLLGTFYAGYDGKMIAGFRTERERALLAYLAVEHDRPHRRETLMALLWPELSDKRARNNLRVNLHRLRKTVELETGHKDWLLVGRNSVQLNSALPIRVDVARFEAHHVAAQRISVEQSPALSERLGHLTEACKLYRGEFLQGFSLDDSSVFGHWATQTREQHHRRILQALYELCAMHIRRGELTKAMPAARRQLELEPWREEAHRQVIEILARRGERTAALAQFKQCRLVLREELGVEPGEETLHLASKIEQLASPRVRNLPALTSPFIGRRIELDQIITFLSAPRRRLLTIVGPGGIGKTRLAIAAAFHLRAAFLDGVCFVPLVAVEEAGGIASAILGALGVPLVDPTRPQEQLRAYLQERQILLVLDNCEHLLPAVRSTVSRLLSLQDINLLATSRERLDVEAETAIVLGGLPVLAEGPPVTYSAGRLFLEHARRHRPRFEPGKDDAAAIARICQSLGGMPLALMLAASWLRLLSPHEMADEIERDLALLDRAPTAPVARHQGMGVVFEQSWARLSTSARRVLSRLSVFVAPFDRHAAEAIAAATLTDLAELVNKSLLQRQEAITGGSSEYTLHPLLCHFAAGKLGEDPVALEEVQESFVNYYTRFLAERKPLFVGPDHLQAMAEILAVYENVRTAIKLACQSKNVPAIARSLYPLLGTTFMSSIPLTEAKRLFGEMARAVTDAVEESGAALGTQRAVLARALAYEAWFALHADERNVAVRNLERALPLAQQGDDQEIQATILNALGIIFRERGNFVRAETCFCQALALVDRPDYRYAWWQQGSFHNNLGISYLQQKKFTEARRHFEQGRRAFDRAESALGLNVVLRSLGDLSLQEGDYRTARAHYEEALATTRRLGSQIYEAQVLVRLGHLSRLVDEDERAATLLLQAHRIGAGLGAAFIVDEVEQLRESASASTS